MLYMAQICRLVEVIGLFVVRSVQSLGEITSVVGWSSLPSPSARPSLRCQGNRQWRPWPFRNILGLELGFAPRRRFGVLIPEPALVSLR